MNVVYRISNRRVYGRTLSLGSLKIVRITLCIPLLAARNKGKTHQLTRKERNRPIKTGPRIKKKRVNNPREYLSIHKNMKYHRLNAGESGANENQTISRGFRFLFFYFFKLYLVVFSVNGSRVLLERLVLLRPVYWKQAPGCLAATGCEHLK